MIEYGKAPMASMKHRLRGFRGFRWQSVLQYSHLLCPAYDTAHLKGDKTYEKQNFNCCFYHYAVHSVDNLPLRCFDWALKSPAAEIMIPQLRRLYDFFRHLFHSCLYQRQGKIRSLCRHVLQSTAFTLSAPLRSSLCPYRDYSGVKL